MSGFIGSYICSYGVQRAVIDHANSKEEAQRFFAEYLRQELQITADPSQISAEWVRVLTKERGVIETK
jgi:hypothetical protein